MGVQALRPSIFDDDDYHYDDRDSLYQKGVSFFGRHLSWVKDVGLDKVSVLFLACLEYSLNEIASFSKEGAYKSGMGTLGSTGIIGDYEINPKVRLSTINGIQYTIEHAKNLWEAVSKEFSTRVHYVYYPTKGHQIYDSTAAIWEKHIQINEDLVNTLVEHWKGLIEEVGGLEGDGCIYHIAHSQGGLITSRAASKLPPEYRKKIHMITYGAHEHPLQEFASLTNVMCRADRIDYFNPYDSDHLSVILVDSISGGIYENHGIEPGNAYWPHIQKTAKDFRGKYESYSSRAWNWAKSCLPSWLGGEGSDPASSPEA